MHNSGNTGSFLLDTADGVPEFLVFVRGTFNDFKAGCDGPSDSDCEKFKQDIKDLAGAMGGLQGLHSGFVDMNLDIQPLERLIDAAPPFSLFVMWRGLGEFAPGREDLPDTLQDIRANLEPVLDDAPFELNVLKSDDLEQSAASVLSEESKAIRCTKFLSKPDRRLKLRNGQVTLRIVAEVFKGVRTAVCKEDMDMTVAATSVGAGGTFIPAPCRSGIGTIFELVDLAAEFVEILKSVYDRCERVSFEDREKEIALASCEPLVSFVLPRRAGDKPVGGELDKMFELLELRHWQVEQIQPLGATEQAEFDCWLTVARSFQQDNDGAKSFVSLCRAYDTLHEVLGSTPARSTGGISTPRNICQVRPGGGNRQP